MPIIAVIIGASPGLIIGLMTNYIFMIIDLAVLIITILLIYALIRMVIDYGLGIMAMLNVGITTASLGMSLMLIWLSAAGSVIMAVELALTAMGLQEHLNKAWECQVPYQGPSYFKGSG